MGKITVMGRSPAGSRDGGDFFLYFYVHTDSQRPSLCVSLSWIGQLIRQGQVLRVWGGRGHFLWSAGPGQPLSWGKVASALRKLESTFHKCGQSF